MAGSQRPSCPSHTRAQLHSCTWGPWPPSRRSPGSWRDSLPGRNGPVSTTGQDLSPDGALQVPGQPALPSPRCSLGRGGALALHVGGSVQSGPPFPGGCSLSPLCLFPLLHLRGVSVCDLGSRVTFQQGCGVPLVQGPFRASGSRQAEGRGVPLPRAHGWAWWEPNAQQAVLTACACSLPDGHPLHLLCCGVCPLPGPSHLLLSLHHGEEGPGPQARPHWPPRCPHGECHLRALTDGRG